MELGGNNFFQEFGDEWEIRNWSVIRQQCRVQGGFFEEGFDESSFEGGRNIACLYGHVYYFGYEGTDRVSVSFKQRRWKGIKAASGCFGFTNDVFDLLLRCGGQL